MRNPASDDRRFRPQILSMVCWALVAGLLYAGLKPFHVPANQVAWVKNGNGLALGEHGTVLSAGGFPRAGEMSIEIWMEPARENDSSSILAFYDPAQPRHFALHQSESDLELRIETSDAWRYSRPERLYVDNALHAKTRVFWTIAVDPGGTTIYRNAGLARQSRTFRPGSGEMDGTLILGTSPIFDENWAGKIYGLAIYDQALNATQVARHYESWANAAEPKVIAQDRCVALYLFAEGRGGAVRNQIQPGPDLYIPRKYTLLRQTVIDPVWRAFHWGFGFWEDTAINIAGFIPFGFLLCARLRWGGSKRAVLVSSAAGLAISLFIELTQAHLPTRDSSMSDVITNAGGTAIGAALYRGAAGRWFDSWINSAA